MWYLTLWALAKTRVGMAVITGVLMLIGALVWVHQHNQRIIADHDATGAAQVQERENESIRRGNAVPADPDRVQQNDRRCRDCR